MKKFILVFSIIIFIFSFALVSNPVYAVVECFCAGGITYEHEEFATQEEQLIWCADKCNIDLNTINTDNLNQDTAQDTNSATFKGIVPNDRGQIVTGDYTLNDFVTIAINLSQWILGITGSLALLMFIYGGTMFLISSGSQEKVTQAKQIILGAVIGLAIIFTSYIIIGFVFKATGADITGTAWSKSDWFSN